MQKIAAPVAIGVGIGLIWWFFLPNIVDQFNLSLQWIRWRTPGIVVILAIILFVVYGRRSKIEK